MIKVKHALNMLYFLCIFDKNFWGACPQTPLGALRAFGARWPRIVTK